MKILIVYGTTEGQTRKIAEFIKDEAQKLGHTVTLADSTEQPPSPADFSLVIIGASIHAGRYQSSVNHFVKDHSHALNQVHSAFFSVSLTAAANEPESWKDLEKITADFLAHANWKPQNVTQVAGALKYTQYDFFKRFILRLIAKKAGGDTDTSHDFEYTDWGKVKEFLLKALKNIKTPLVVTP